MYPIDVRREDSATIVIDWDDGTQSRWTATQLRTICPCATCREKRTSGDDAAVPRPDIGRTLPVLSVAEARPMVIESMRPVGNYAYNVIFSDGHRSGLFTFDRLRQSTDTPEVRPES